MDFILASTARHQYPQDVGIFAFLRRVDNAVIHTIQDAIREAQNTIIVYTHSLDDCGS